MTEQKSVICIEGNRLFWERPLICKGFPDSYICIDEKRQRYFVLMTYDYDVSQYLILPISNELLADVLSGNLSIREAGLHSEIMYFIESFDWTPDDLSDEETVEHLLLKEHSDLLPQGLFIQKEDAEMKKYIKSLRRKPHTNKYRTSPAYCC